MTRAMSFSPGPRDHLAISADVAVSVVVVRRRRAVVVTVAGEVDTSTVSQVHQAVDAALREHPPLLVVDLSAVTFLSCAGISVLVAGHRQAGDITRMRVVAMTRSTLRPLQLTGLLHHLVVHSSYEDALTAHARDTCGHGLH